MLAGATGRVYVRWDSADRGHAMVPLTPTASLLQGAPAASPALLPPCSCSAAESAAGINPRLLHPAPWGWRFLIRFSSNEMKPSQLFQLFCNASLL